MSVLIGIRIELLDAGGSLAGAIWYEDRFEVLAVPQRGDVVALAAIASLPAVDSSLPELQSVHALADAFPFMTVRRIEHLPAADHQVGERPGWTMSAQTADLGSSDPFSRAVGVWRAKESKPPGAP